MAAVTVHGSPYYNVAGSKKSQLYNISGNTGDTLTVGLNTVNKVTPDPGTITSTSVAAGSVQGTSVITFTTGGGAFTTQNVEVIGN
jgi:hypothetical protein